LARQASFVVLLAGVGVALASCAPSEQPADATVLGGDPGSVCVAVAPGGSIVFGDVLSLADGVSAIEIESVSLVKADGVQVVEAFVMPVGSGNPIMTMSLDDPSQGWAGRQIATGFHVTEPANVVVEARRSGASNGEAQALRVTYRTEDGVTRYDDGSTSLTLADSCL